MLLLILRTWFKKEKKKQRKKKKAKNVHLKLVAMTHLGGSAAQNKQASKLLQIRIVQRGLVTHNSVWSQRPSLREQPKQKLMIWKGILELYAKGIFYVLLY